MTTTSNELIVQLFTFPAIINSGIETKFSAGNHEID